MAFKLILNIERFCVEIIGTLIQISLQSIPNFRSHFEQQQSFPESIIHKQKNPDLLFSEGINRGTAAAIVLKSGNFSI